MPAPDPYLTTKQIAVKFGVTPATVARWLRQGRMQGWMPWHHHGRYGGWRVRESELWRLARLGVKSTTK
jgi:excisionase family DNA binding protein